MIFTESDYHTLAALTLGRPDYPGNRTAQGVVESPHGDGKLDGGKKFAHVATKYLTYFPGTVPNRILRKLNDYLLDAYMCAGRLAHEIGVPSHMWPSLQHGALRVLEYPAGVGASHVHTDFDLFTVNLWRSVPNAGLGAAPYHIGEIGELVGMGPATPHYVEPMAEAQYSLVYFAMPDHGAVLPSGQSVGEWLAERMKRSRY